MCTIVGEEEVSGERDFKKRVLVDLARVILAQPNWEMSIRFSELLVLSAPSFFEALWGSSRFVIARRCFLRKRNLFSYQHALFVEEEGRIAGMALGCSFDEKHRERLLTGLLMARYLLLSREWKRIPFLLHISPLGEINQGEFYLSNLAVYPEFQRRGLGSMLLGELEIRARGIGADYLLLDVEGENTGAFAFYRRLGYSLEGALPPVKLGSALFQFLRMKKCLK
ncbi:GNAT family N-acetyltransferase [Thermatribacter velox]|uniref:GNAT family N-acetyltransferase n=1 Tax=Thermatribacter velox TaxID=3039681 RepID=A0ABZ2YGC2_9BACT